MRAHKNRHPGHGIAFAALLAVSGLSPEARAFTLLSSTNPTPNGAAEIVSYTPDGFRVVSTFSSGGTSYGAEIYTMNAAGQLALQSTVDFAASFSPAGGGDVSSVAFDPSQRKFGAVTLMPLNSGSTTLADNSLQSTGKVGFFNYQTGAVIATLDVGYHPDSVSFSPDGAKLFVINEAEHDSNWNVGGQTNRTQMGGITIYDLSTVPSNPVAGDFASLTTAHVGFNIGDMANAGVATELSGLRTLQTFSAGVQAGITGTQPTTLDQYEPEFGTFKDGKLYVTLQEANGVGVLDVATAKWEKFHNLGYITSTIDASDQDGGPNIDDTVRGMPMPDTIASYTVSGTTYFVIANEGDARTDDADVSRLASIDDPSVAGGSTNSILGRLNVLRDQGDAGIDGDIDTPTMMGTRSFTIWNASTGAKVFDSSDSPATKFETILLALEPTIFNNNQTGTMDSRSDDKGPEPEALSIGQFGASTLAFIGMERQGAILVYDITNPAAPFFVGNLPAGTNYANGLVGPESLVYIAAADSPTGQAALIGGFEVSNGGIGVYSVPEPSRALLVAMGAIGLIFRRRRSRD